MNYETIHQKRDGEYHYTVGVMPEDIPAEHFFDTDPEVVEKIRTGEYLHFMVRVQCRVKGVLLGEAYLGSCVYSSYGEFLRGDYIQDLYTDAKDEAQRTLAELIKTCA